MTLIVVELSWLHILDDLDPESSYSLLGQTRILDLIIVDCGYPGFRRHVDRTNRCDLYFPDQLVVQSVAGFVHNAENCFGTPTITRQLISIKFLLLPQLVLLEKLDLFEITNYQRCLQLKKEELECH